MSEPLIDCDFPGGNIVFERIDGDKVFIHQELRGTRYDWFYWQFRIRGAAGRRLEFQLTASRAIGTRGPAFSSDEGRSWRWLGAESVVGKNAFAYEFASNDDSVRFCFCIPYLQSDLERWLLSHQGDAALKRDVLCRSRQGREVELLRVGPEEAGRIAVMARHHSCESMANFVIEGLLDAALDGDATGEWFRSKVELLVVPFVDKDGVENGDQGKGRAPRDHGRDYAGESIYPECAAVREMIGGAGAPPLLAAIDLHCPSIDGNRNETLFVVGAEDEAVWRGQQEFSRILAEHQRGPLVYDPTGSIPFGEGWNNSSSYSEGMGFRRWSSGLNGVRLSTTFEIPYANHKEATMTPDNARAFGRDLARALSIHGRAW